MNAAQKLNTIRTIRTMTVGIMGMLGLYATAIICVIMLRRDVTDASLHELGLGVIVVLIAGLLITALFCLSVYHFFSLWGTITLPKAVRLNEAMRLLQATTHMESINTLKYYDITVYKAKVPLGQKVMEDVPCNIISTFHSPLFFHSDRLQAFGSEQYCCDYDEIQSIIQSEQNKWGQSSHKDNITTAQLVALEKVNAELREENKRVTGLYTAAFANAENLKKQIIATYDHMKVLILLTHTVTCEVKPPRTLTRNDIKRKYLAIGKSYGIETAPAAYVELFREAMPKEYINQGGAPRQG